jgi:hypothetical protein
MNKFVKYPALMVMMLLVAMVAAACNSGGGGASNTPEDAAKAWFEAAFSNNLDALKAQTCAASQDQVETVAEAYATLGETGSAVDTSGLTYTKASESGDNATVNIGGSVKATVQGVEMDQPMPEIPMPLVKENGAWKVCNLG